MYGYDHHSGCSRIEKRALSGVRLDLKLLRSAWYNRSRKHACALAYSVASEVAVRILTPDALRPIAPTPTMQYTVDPTTSIKICS